MVTYLKAQASSVIGSIMDFLATIFFVEVLHCWYVAGNLAGNVVGAAVQFIISRSWAFQAGGENVSGQIVKYLLVWIGNLGLSAAGIYFFTHYIKLNYIVSKTITSVSLGLTYNFFMQKKFVFAK
jgi:putative flippase GtrA